MADSNLSDMKDSCLRNIRTIYSICKQRIASLEKCTDFPFISCMDAYQFEREVVRVIAEIARSRGIPDSVLAKQAWPHQEAPDVSWRRMRNNEKSPKRLNIEEAVLLAAALDMSIMDVCGIAYGRMLQMGSQNKEDFPPAQPKPGRPATKGKAGITPSHEAQAALGAAAGDMERDNERA